MLAAKKRQNKKLKTSPLCSARCTGTKVHPQTIATKSSPRSHSLLGGTGFCARLCAELEFCLKLCAEFELCVEFKFFAELKFCVALEFCGVPGFRAEPQLKLCGVLAEHGSFAMTLVKFFLERRVLASARLFARIKFGSFATLARLGELALFAPSRVEFFVKFNIKFRLKFLAEFSQGFITETFAEFKALFSAQFGICAEFKFSARTAKFKADFLSRFLTCEAE